jgi:S1-C subfamily serine protease
MIHFRRGAICVLPFLSIFALGLAAQNHPASSLPSHSEPVVAAVVQLLAVGPAGKGQNHECAATGFLVNEDGYILTNAHVVEKSQECLAQSPGAKIVARLANLKPAHLHAAEIDTVQPGEAASPAVSCVVLGVDDIHDLAVLKTERPFRTGAPGGTNPFVFLDTTEATLGTPVRVTGHPAFAWVAFTQSGHIFGRKSLPLFNQNAEPTDMMVMDIPLKPGNSGSPVYLEADGGVVGVVERQDTSDITKTLAVPIRYAIDLLNRFAVKWHAVQK